MPINKKIGVPVDAYQTTFLSRPRPRFTSGASVGVPDDGAVPSMGGSTCAAVLTSARDVPDFDRPGLREVLLEDSTDGGVAVVRGVDAS